MTGATQKIANNKKLAEGRDFGFKPGESVEFEIIDNRPVEDPIVQQVINKFVSRHRKGMQTYGVTMQSNTMPLSEWLVSLQEELMDAANYIERVLQELNDKKEKQNA